MLDTYIYIVANANTNAAMQQLANKVAVSSLRVPKLPLSSSPAAPLEIKDWRSK